MSAERTPDAQALHQFLLGQLPEKDLEAVARYLQDTPDALSGLDALPADTLVTALRDSAQLFGLDAPDVRGLIDRFASLTDAGEQPEAAAELPAGASGTLGGYRILRVLGRGGMGVVFEAEDPGLGRKVALKVMAAAAARKPGARERFLREARAAAAVDHDHITPIYQVGEDRGVPFLAMPLLRGETLDQRLRTGPLLAPAEVLRVGRQAAEGLAAAHAAGLVHRDVKPSNVWLEQTPDGAFRRVRLFDFGLAKPATPADGATADDLTQTGAVLGTPAYMAPEQARGSAVDHRADLFSLGSVLYQMTTGLPPFWGSDTFAVLTALAVTTPPAPRAVNPSVPAALSDLIQRLLAKDPAARPQTAREVADELARIEQDEAAKPRPAAPRPSRRRFHLTVAAVLALALVGVGAYFGKTIVRVVTGRGELVIEVDDPDVEVVVKDGRASVSDKTTNRSFVLTAGDGEVTFLDPATGAKAVTKAFTISRGETTVVRATAAELAADRPQPADAGPVPPRFAVVKTDGWFAVSPDGKQLAVPLGGDHPEVWVFDTATAEVRRKLTGLGQRAMRSAFFPDGRRLVTANVGQKEAVVWDLETGRPVRTLPYGAECLSVAVRRDGRQVAVAGTDVVKLYDADTGAELYALPHPGKIHGLAYSPDGSLLASASEAKSVRTWEPNNGEQLRSFDDLPGAMVGAAFSPDGKLLAAGGDRVLRVWEVGSWREVLARDDVVATWVGFGADARRLWAGPWSTGRGPVKPRRWDVTTGAFTELDVPPLRGWNGFGLSPDAKVLYAADSFSGVWACDPATGRPKVAPPAGLRTGP